MYLEKPEYNRTPLHSKFRLRETFKPILSSEPAIDVQACLAVAQFSCSFNDNMTTIGRGRRIPAAALAMLEPQPSVLLQACSYSRPKQRQQCICKENMKAPAFKLPIYIKNIQKGKHGSDTDAYDAHGRFVPEKFEEIFKKHAHTRPDALTGKELQALLKANRERNDLKGRVGALLEWNILYSLCKDKDGFLHKETVKAIYDGSLFLKLEQETKEAKESGKKK